MCGDLSRPLYASGISGAGRYCNELHESGEPKKQQISKLSVVFLKIVQFLQDLVQRLFVFFSVELVCYIYDDGNDC